MEADALMSFMGKSFDGKSRVGIHDVMGALGTFAETANSIRSVLEKINEMEDRHRLRPKLSFVLSTNGCHAGLLVPFCTYGRKRAFYDN